MLLTTFDPTNRLVADSLEADWNKLRALNAAQEQYEEQRKNDRAEISEQQRASLAALAHNFPQLWQNLTMSDRVARDSQTLWWIVRLWCK